MKGYIKFHRKMLDHHIVGRKNPDFYIAWQWMVMTACWRPTKHDIGGKTVVIERGQLAYSTRQLADEFGWSEARVRRFLSRLKNDAMIDAATDAGKTIITIRNYDEYQTGETEGDASIDALSDAEATQERRTKEEIKNNPPIVPPGDGPALQECLDTWNAMAKANGLPTASLTEKRRKALKARLKDHSREDFAKAVQQIPADAFRLGQNDRRWKANIDYLLRPDNITKLLEEIADEPPEPEGTRVWCLPRNRTLEQENRSRAVRGMKPMRPDGSIDEAAPDGWGDQMLADFRAQFH